MSVHMPTDTSTDLPYLYIPYIYIPTCMYATDYTHVHVSYLYIYVSLSGHIYNTYCNCLDLIEFLEGRFCDSGSWQVPRKGLYKEFRPYHKIGSGWVGPHPLTVRYHDSDRAG